MSKPKEETRVISFRVPVDRAKTIDRQAKKAKKKRAKFVETLFIDALDRHMEATATA